MLPKSNENILICANEIIQKYDSIIEPLEKQASSFDTIDLFNLLHDAINQNDTNIEIILVDLLNKIKKLNVGSTLTTSHFEPLIFLLEKPEIYSIPIIDNTLNIIYYLISQSLPRSTDYLMFFSQPQFFDYYLQNFEFTASQMIITFMIHKKNQLYINYQEQINQIIQNSPTTSAMIDLLTECISISTDFSEIENISTQLDLIMKTTEDSSIFSSALKSIRQIIRKYPISCEFFAQNSLFYLKDTNDDLENIDLLKLYYVIVKQLNSFEFLVSSGDSFVNFVVLTLQTTNNLLLSSLTKFLSYQADVSCFMSYPMLIDEILKKIRAFSYNDKKNLMYFLLNLAVSSNAEFIKALCQANFVELMIPFMDVANDKGIVMKLLMVVGLIFQNGISISVDIFEYLEKLSTVENAEIASLAMKVLEMCMDE